MLLPRRVKYRKQHRGRMTGKATRGNFVAYGDFGIVAMEPCWITSNQIEASRIAINRHVKRGGQVWIKIFPDKPVTSKPAETRMGSGKGSPDHWVAVVSPAAFSLRSLVLQKKLQERPCALQAISSLAKRSLLLRNRRVT